MTTAVDKDTLKHGAMVAVETTSYGSGSPSLSTSTDGVLAYETPEVEIDYEDLGEREGVSGAGTTNLRPVTPSARKGSFDLVHYFKGPGAAYSATVFSTIHNLLRGAGMSATVDITGSAEKWTYAGISTSLESLVAEIYARGQKYNFKGAFAHKLEISASGLVVPKMTFNVMGICTALPLDAAVASITYPYAAVQNPKSTNISLTMNDTGTAYAAKARDWTFTYERELDVRVDQSLANLDHAGFFNGARTVGLSVTMEAATLKASSPWASATEFNPYAFYENAVDIDLDLNVGGTQYNRFKISGPTARLTKPPTEGKEGNIALWTLDFSLVPSADGLENDFTIVTD